MTFQFESISDFFAMGGYGFYVWLSYGVSFIAMIGLIWLSRREQKAILAQAKKEIVREEKLKQTSQ
ncbi:TPA: heme exporter protein CcmD [Mannheimia haemolytica]|uniref:Heme exporter protein D n=1 Tax=Mannheimia haemolytica TaxID=75985 RepID=A0A248ZXZ8_MANHA|nr:heme exporter protein CcmD [Mannheimia haemolytica]AWW70503.1 heme exporter protein CcmD [Pasteurellaceae bacterium 12565]AGI31546.1 heme exporter protein CcmD [Mannheimia haemolytica USDA-ARS-USMARC-183]AGI36345.1 heme exporter protein CcmD [Mannheimia haemolytica USDA-ARS-USMARC-185]AGK00812.1 putative CcmD-like protoheme IX ABC transport system - membrane protein [Mannheimia haemolytica M42548]AGQ25656.1 hemagglutination activity protein [Mannheimia haemolytica D153]